MMLLLWPLLFFIQKKRALDMCFHTLSLCHFVSLKHYPKIVESIVYILQSIIYYLLPLINAEAK